MMIVVSALIGCLISPRSTSTLPLLRVIVSLPSRYLMINRLDVSKLVIEKGANLFMKNNDGVRAIDISVNRNTCPGPLSPVARPRPPLVVRQAPPPNLQLLRDIRCRSILLIIILILRCRPSNAVVHPACSLQATSQVSSDTSPSTSLERTSSSEIRLRRIGRRRNPMTLRDGIKPRWLRMRGRIVIRGFVERSRIVRGIGGCSLV
jgi:hypothetical protein